MTGTSTPCDQQTAMPVPGQLVTVRHRQWVVADDVSRGEAGFETFPQPELTGRMDRVGDELDSFRRSVMLGRQLVLTKLYNLVHDPTVTDKEIGRLQLNHERYAEELGQGLQAKKKPKRTSHSAQRSHIGRPVEPEGSLF